MTKLDRLARSVVDAHAIAQQVTGKGARLSFNGSTYDPADPVTKMVFGMLAVVAEFERDLISMRTREGLVTAKLRGRLNGRPPKLWPERERLLVRTVLAGELTIGEVATMFGVGRSTVGRALDRAGVTRPGRATCCLIGSGLTWALSRHGHRPGPDPVFRTNGSITALVALTRRGARQTQLLGRHRVERAALLAPVAFPHVSGYPPDECQHHRRLTARPHLPRPAAPNALVQCAAACSRANPLPPAGNLPITLPATSAALTVCRNLALIAPHPASDRPPGARPDPRNVRLAGYRPFIPAVNRPCFERRSPGR